MKKTLLGIILIALPLVCFAKDVVSLTTPGIQNQPLRLSIKCQGYLKSKASKYNSLETIILTAKLENVGKDSLTVLLPLVTTKQIGDGLTIQGPKGVYKYVGLLDEWLLDKDSFIQLKPKDSVEVSFPLNLKKYPRFKLNDLGKYTITYKYFNEDASQLGIRPWQVTLNSNTITINIVKGEGVISQAEAHDIVTKLIQSEKKYFPLDNYGLSKVNSVKRADSQPFWVWKFSPKKHHKGKSFSVWVNKNTGEGYILR
jgi:hypothetical protein